MMTLDQLDVGKMAVVTAIHSTGANRRRLMDLGLLPGTTVQAELKSPLGDPIAYRIRGATIALRQSQARTIDVQLIEAEEKIS